MKFRAFSIALTMAGLLSFVMLVLSCASTPPPSQAAGEAESEVYPGSGRGDSLAAAINDAKIDAIRNAVIDMIGADRERAHRETLDQNLYATRNPNAYVRVETMTTLRKENLGTVDDMDMVYEIRIEVDTDAVRRVLERSGVFGDAGVAGRGGDTAEGAADADAAAEREETARRLVEEEQTRGEDSAGSQGDRRETGGQETGEGRTGLPEAAARALTDEERAFVERYLDSMTYMVYFAEDANVDPFLMKSAVTQANSYLARQGTTAVDPNQVEQLKEDRQMVLEQETGEAAGVLLWVAERLNADVYIEVDAETGSEQSRGDYYATANITLRMFETSTGQLLGAVNRRSQRTFSRTSRRDAELNALQSSVYQAMPEVLTQARTQMAQYLARGVRYELVLQSTPDARAVSRFRSRLRDEVESLETVSQTADQTVLEVYMYGRLEELEDAIYEVADSVPGFESLYFVLRRGKSITFNTGM